jgi:predicted transcriptional regulator
MMNIEVTEQWLPVFEALASNVRIKIIQKLAVQPMNIKELAQSLGLSSAIMTMHVRKLEEAGIIHAEMTRSKGAIQKTCKLNVEVIKVTFPRAIQNERKFYEVSLPIGHFTDFEIFPTCGLATTEKIIGKFDEPRCFSFPDRVNAKVLWFGKGFVEYKFPNQLLKSEQLEEIEISMELSSEAPLTNENWPSDISFFVNKTYIGNWTSPGDFGSHRGKYTPLWWPSHINQYGLLKFLKINSSGTYMDGDMISNVTIHDINTLMPHWSLRIEVAENAKNVGGCSLFGAGFGNYDQDIIIKQYYR